MSSSQPRDMDQLTWEESRVFQFIAETLPDLAPYFQQQLPYAREQILQRLINALWREKIAGMAKRAMIDTQKNVVVPLDHLAKRISFTILQEFSFSRIKVGNILLQTDGDHLPRQPTPTELAQLMADERFYSFEHGAVFVREVENSTANLAFSLAWKAYRREALPIPEKREAEWNQLHVSEHLVFSGHPLHPGTKAKIGMTPQDVYRYSPEFAQPTPIRFAAVRHDHVQISGSNMDLDRLNHHFFSFVNGLKAAFIDRIGSDKHGEYLLFPVHPWQYQHIIQSLFHDEIEQGIIRLLDHSVLNTLPTLSLRTVVPHVPGKILPHIKLPIHVQTTSAIRTLSPHAVQNGTMLTQLLREILAREPECERSMELLDELGGAHFCLPKEAAYPDTARELSFLLRTNPLANKKADEAIYVAAALPEATQPDGEPLLVRLIDGSKLATDTLDAVLLFFARYCDMVLPSFLLLSKYGIGLELHLQNSLIAFRGCLPHRLLVRDLGGGRIDPERLRRRGFTPAFLSGSAIAADTKEAQSKLIHSLLQNHLAELITAVCTWHALPEEPVWNVVRTTLRRAYADWKLDSRFGTEAAQDEAALFAPIVRTKALTAMRLTGDVQQYAYISVRNPIGAKTGESP